MKKLTRRERRRFIPDLLIRIAKLENTVQRLRHDVSAEVMIRNQHSSKIGTLELYLAEHQGLKTVIIGTHRDKILRPLFEAGVTPIAVARGDVKVDWREWHNGLRDHPNLAEYFEPASTEYGNEVWLRVKLERFEIRWQNPDPRATSVYRGPFPPKS